MSKVGWVIMENNICTKLHSLDVHIIQLELNPLINYDFTAFRN